ncbi:MAG: sigma-70 family RNA polymerase sigma factor [Fibrobacter sp.]|jgi:RNA polymerase primary sigma factor|uniref:sigma-70 family RNA polymerase sigma factor n=1 Tax=Fibrobacter sp. TaxID=35828 RepID=UPI0025D0578E|nr:sigma-70 family RNA polymerase sigma factor [Fibrobacter sp.]MDY6262870.1 sigma-70 family RNA polymerase sigma factor [Fibrobacter sp.]MDY6387532.1 sigma-70 family RNA polymerase sigma factor [Fibrobacter sp.]
MTKNTHVRDDRDVYFQYLNDISKYPLLTKEQEKVLLQKVREGSREAMDLLVKSNLRFVVNIANLYKGQGLDVNELINEGNMGLIEAARRFDQNQKIKFISYAVWWVRQNITRAIAERGRLVRISAEKELVLRRFAKKGGQMHQVVGGGLMLDPKSLEGVSKYKADDIEKILMMGNKSTSLDAPVGEDGDMTLGDTIAAAEFRTDDLAEQHNRNKLFDKAMDNSLSEQEKEIIKLYFGFKMDSDLNLKEIAPMIGLSKERTRQLKDSALEKLRNEQLTRVLNDAA